MQMQTPFYCMDTNVYQDYGLHPLAPVNLSFFLNPFANSFLLSKPLVSTEAPRWMDLQILWFLSPSVLDGTPHFPQGPLEEEEGEIFR